MKIRAINRSTQKEAILNFPSIKEARKRNPYFKEFKEVIDEEEYKAQSYKNIYGDIEK